MVLELLPLALSDWKIGSSGGIELVSSLGCFTSRNFRNAAGKSARDRTGAASPGLLKTYRPHFFAPFPFLSSGNVRVVLFCEFV